MPYEIRKGTDRCPASKPFGVFNQQTGRWHGCHETRESAIEQMRALYAAEEETSSMNHLHLASPNRVEGIDGEVIRGLASSIGNIDYAGRAFLPGAYGTAAKRVPFLLNHEEVPLGESILVPTPQGLRHESKIVGNPVQPRTGVPIRQLLHSGYNATSIGWIDKGSYFGWRQFEKAEPERARQWASMGLPQREDVRYFAEVEIMENSLCPVGANPQALLDAASLLPAESEERGYLLELAKLSGVPEKAAANEYVRHPQQHVVQAIHDHSLVMGANCAQTASFQWTTPNNLTGVTTTNPAGLTATYSIPNLEKAASSKPKKARFSMPDGSYPINNCSDVSDAAHLVGHSKKYSREQVARHVRRAAKALNCSLPESWQSGGGDSGGGASLPPGEQAQISEDELQNETIQAIDACLDEAIQELRDGDTEQALALLIAADENIDGLMEDMNIADAEDRDEDEGSSEDQGQASAEPLTLFEITNLERELADLSS